MLRVAVDCPPASASFWFYHSCYVANSRRASKAYEGFQNHRIAYADSTEFLGFRTQCRLSKRLWRLQDHTEFLQSNKKGVFLWFLREFLQISAQERACLLAVSAVPTNYHKNNLRHLWTVTFSSRPYGHGNQLPASSKCSLAGRFFWLLKLDN